MSYADAGRRVADRHELAHVVPLLVVYATDSLIAARTGDTDRALHGVDVVNTSLARLGEDSPRTRIFGHQLLAETEHALQNGAEARRHLNEARRVHRQHPLSDALAAELDRVEALLAQGPDRLQPRHHARSPRPSAGCSRCWRPTSRCPRSRRSCT